MLAAMNSGHEGSMGTIHANSCRQALSKLRTYTKMAEEALTDEVVTDMVAETVDLVCQLRLLPDGRRVLTEVAELAGVEAGRLLTNELIAPGPDGVPRYTGVRPRQADRLAAAGWQPTDWLGNGSNGARP